MVNNSAVVMVPSGTVENRVLARMKKMLLNREGKFVISHHRQGDKIYIEHNIWHRYIRVYLNASQIKTLDCEVPQCLCVNNPTVYYTDVIVIVFVVVVVVFFVHDRISRDSYVLLNSAISFLQWIWESASFGRDREGSMGQARGNRGRNPRSRSCIVTVRPRNVLNVYVYLTKRRCQSSS